MAYESPIRLVTEIENKIIEDQEKGIYKAVLSYRIDISKDELFKLLYGDRKQYDKGYSDGRADATKHGRWEKDGEIMMFGDIPVKCSQCGFKTLQDAAHRMDYHYCPNCGARMDESED